MGGRVYPTAVVSRRSFYPPPSAGTPAPLMRPSAIKPFESLIEICLPVGNGDVEPVRVVANGIPAAVLFSVCGLRVDDWGREASPTAFGFTAGRILLEL